MAVNVTLKIKRGKESDRANYTPQEGELIYCTDTLALYGGDGSTAGGLKIDSSTFIQIAEKGAANGVATLDANGRIPTGQLPSLAITEVVVCDSQDCQTSSDTQIGDICVRTDESKTYIRKSTDNNDMSDWVELEFPDAVKSVNGKTGNVDLSLPDLNDVNSDMSPNEDDVLIYQNGAWTSTAQSNIGRTKFINLDDTPTSYSGQAGKFLKVNDDENALEFTSSVDGGFF